MKRQVVGLHTADSPSGHHVPDGMYLVRVNHARYQWHAHKPFYVIRFVILQPEQLANRPLNARIYCTPKALWKLNWFLRDFGYDTDLIGRDEVDDKALVGLCGVVRISNVVVNGISLPSLDAFAPSGQWEEVSSSTPISEGVR
jgi:hypothetical protein